MKTEAIKINTGRGKKRSDQTFLKRFLPALAPAAALNFALFIFLPSDSFFANFADFPFPYQSFILLNFGAFIVASALFAAIVAAFRGVGYKTAYAVLTALSMGVFVQYMFLNQGLMLLDGKAFDLNDFVPQTIVSSIVWAILIIAAIIAALKFEKFWNKVRIGIPIVLCVFQFLATAITVISAGGEAFEYRAEYMKGEEQFIVSKKRNVVMFVLDAVDNDYFEQIRRDNPGAFDGLEDFTLYTNTCSVFDSTPTSMTQMLTGMDFAVELPGKEWYNTAWHGTKANVFFSRFHEAGYTINGYTIDSNLTSNYEGKFDNYDIFDDPKENIGNIDMWFVFKQFLRLSGYKALPFVYKPLVNSATISFESANLFSGGTIYDNSEFDKNLQLKTSETDKNYFITQHLNGTHFPCSDVIGETEFLLGMMKKYCDQLKELGVYDDTAIIITSDHGAHNDGNHYQAATPIFMVKKMGERNDKMKISTAPVYHEDIQATLLELAGLYDKDGDEELFGKTVFDFSDGELRTRSWYDRGYSDDYDKVTLMASIADAWSSCNIYREYTYTGDTSVLKLVCANDNAVYHQMKDNKG